MRNHIFEILVNHIELQSSLADPKVWFKVVTDKAGNEYYTYIIVYVDGFINVDKYPQKYMNMLESKCTVKPSIIGYHRVYIQANVGEVSYGNVSHAWGLSSDFYVQETINNVNKRLKEDGLEYSKKISDIKYLPKDSFSSV